MTSVVFETSEKKARHATLWKSPGLFNSGPYVFNQRRGKPFVCFYVFDINTIFPRLPFPFHNTSHSPYLFQMLVHFTVLCLFWQFYCAIVTSLVCDHVMLSTACFHNLFHFIYFFNKTWIVTNLELFKKDFRIRFNCLLCR